MIKALLYCFLVISTINPSTSKPETFTNPVLKGGYPDPSVTRVEDTYYMVNSSFEYFPGLPLHISKDLINWKPVGYALHRKSQVTGDVNLVDVQSDGGIHAPSIRYHDGLFYVITTNVYVAPAENSEVEFVNFILTAKSIEGPWSDPVVVKGAPGIDPDIFFDDDGRVWYVGTQAPENPNFDGEGEIWIQQLDKSDWQLTGEKYLLWRGACRGLWAEGPHIYKRDGRYYLMVAEGGTSFNHAVTIAVSDDITGPYVSNDRNPILTSRHLTYDNWVNSTGHADLVELHDGRWVAVMLGIRADNKRKTNMGRETHIAPVIWEREPFEWKENRYLWPVIAPNTGRVERENPVFFEGTKQQKRQHFRDEFENNKLGVSWNFRRVPLHGIYQLNPDNGGQLKLTVRPEVLKERGRAAWLGFRQTESSFTYTASMQMTTNTPGVEAGISLVQKDINYLNLLVKRTDDNYQLQLTIAQPGKAPTVKEAVELRDYKGQIQLRVISDNKQYRYEYSLDDGKEYKLLTTTSADLILSQKYTGANLGLYATSNGQKVTESVTFDWVDYKVN